MDLTPEEKQELIEILDPIRLREAYAAVALTHTESCECHSCKAAKSTDENILALILDSANTGHWMVRGYGEDELVAEYQAVVDPDAWLGREHHRGGSTELTYNEACIVIGQDPIRHLAWFLDFNGGD